MGNFYQLAGCGFPPVSRKLGNLKWEKNKDFWGTIAPMRAVAKILAKNYRFFIKKTENKHKFVYQRKPDVMKKYFLLLAVITASAIFNTSLFAQTRPNVVLIITDDQGYGDLGFTGNPHVKTSTLDNFAQNSVRFNQFYVS